MTATAARKSGIGGPVVAGDVELWVHQRGEGPDVLLIAGLSDPAEAWAPQLDGLADRYRLVAFDNRGAGRSPLPPDDFTVGGFADDAANVLRAVGVSSVHVAGFSGGSATAQERALRHPELVRSLVLVSTWARPDTYLRTLTSSWCWLGEGAPSERALLEAFFLWIYTPRAHEDGTVDQIIEEALAFPCWCRESGRGAERISVGGRRLGSPAPGELQGPQGSPQVIPDGRVAIIDPPPLPECRGRRFGDFAVRREV